MIQLFGIQIPKDIAEALVAACVIIIPLCAQIVVACLRERLAILEAKLDRNTRITERALTEAREAHNRGRAVGESATAGLSGESPSDAEARRPQ